MPHIEQSLNELKTELLTQSSKIDQILSLLSTSTNTPRHVSSLDLNTLLEKVSTLLNIPPREIRGKSREESILNARSLFVFYAYKNLNESFKSIGSYLNRDYSSIICLYEKFASRLKVDAEAVSLLLDLDET